MTKAQEYHRGNWTEIDDPMSTFGTGTIENLAQKMGFTVETKIGDEWDTFSLVVYREEEKSKTGHKYLVVINTSDDTFELVYITDWPSYLALMKEILPLLQVTHDLNRES